MGQVKIACMGALILSIGACQSSEHLTASSDDTGRSPIRQQAIASPSEEPVEAREKPVSGQEIPPQYQPSYGSEVFYQAAPLGKVDIGSSNEENTGESYVFRNAPIDTVLNQILGEAFGLSYSIDPRISGSITLRLEGISTAEQAIAGLNAALNLQGYEIARDSGTYLARQRGSSGQTATGLPVFVASGGTLPAGASSAVLQIRYASTEEITSIAQTMLPSGLIRYSDDSRGMVVLSGEPDEVSAGVQLLKSLDVNWLSAVSNALIPIQNTDPSEIAADLEPILSRLGGVSVVPMDRLQSLMIIARSGETLDQTREWIARLDQEAKPTLARDLLIYEARYVNAEDLLALAGAVPVSGVGAVAGRGYQPASGGPSDPVSANAPGARPGAISSPNAFLGGSAFNRSPTPDGLYEDLSIRVDPGQNAVVARGPANELQSLSELLSALDKPKRQVQIEATIVEVSLADSTALGVQWDAVEDAVAATFTDSTSGNVASLFPGVSVSYINTDISAVVNALATTSDVEIVSSPRMLVLNNETARLQIGDQVPVITQSAVSISDPGAPVVNSTSYRDTGVILTVTPRIRAGGMVEVEVTQEVSNVSETTSSSIDSPTISQRTIESILAVPNGSTAVLGGLMSSTRAWTETGVPILKDAPLIGAAFRSTNQTERRTELIVLIEPTVVLSVDPVSDIPALLRNALIRAREAPAG